MTETSSLKILSSHLLLRIQKNTCQAKSLPAPSLGSSLSDDFEERLAIAEWDGHQSSEQATKIAYQDAFIMALVALPLETPKSDLSPQVWLNQRIQKAQRWCEA